MDARLRVAGSVLGVGSGLLVAAGARLPWEWEERFVSTGPRGPGCFGWRGPGSIEFSGRQVGNGELAFIAGLVMAVAALLAVTYPAARRWGRAVLAAAVVVLAAAVIVAGSAVGGWLLNRLPGGVPAAGGMELCGILLGLAAVPLCLPGPARRRVRVLAATAALCAMGAALAAPVSAPPPIEAEVGMKTLTCSRLPRFPEPSRASANWPVVDMRWRLCRNTLMTGCAMDWRDRLGQPTLLVLYKTPERWRHAIYGAGGGVVDGALHLGIDAPVEEAQAELTRLASDIARGPLVVEWTTDKPGWWAGKVANSPGAQPRVSGSA